MTEWSEATSPNWSGYSAPPGDVTGVRARWNEPRVSGAATGHLAIWIGVGGWGTTYNNIVQIGTLASVGQDGQVTHRVWYETLPPNQWQITGTHVNPGDEVSASVELADAATNAWRLATVDLTTGRTYQVTVHFLSRRMFADFVIEDPDATSNNGPPYFPLPTFDQITFGHAQVRYDDGWLPLGKANTVRVTLARSGVGPIKPGALTDDGFTVKP